MNIFRLIPLYLLLFTSLNYPMQNSGQGNGGSASTQTQASQMVKVDHSSYTDSSGSDSSTITTNIAPPIQEPAFKLEATIGQDLRSTFPRSRHHMNPDPGLSDTAQARETLKTIDASYSAQLRIQLNQVSNLVHRVVEFKDPKAMVELAQYRVSFDQRPSLDTTSSNTPIIVHQELNSIAAEINDKLTPYLHEMLEYCFDSSGAVHDDINVDKIAEVLTRYYAEFSATNEEFQRLLKELAEEHEEFKEHYEKLFPQSFGNKLRYFVTTPFKAIGRIGADSINWMRGVGDQRAFSGFVQKIQSNKFNKDLQLVPELIAKGDVAQANKIVDSYKKVHQINQWQYVKLQQLREKALLEHSTFTKICLHNQHLPIVKSIETRCKKHFLSNPGQVVKTLNELLSADSSDLQVQQAYDLFFNEYGLVKIYSYDTEFLGQFEIPEAIHSTQHVEQRVVLHELVQMATQTPQLQPFLKQGIEYVSMSCKNYGCSDRYLSLAQAVVKAINHEGNPIILHCKNLQLEPETRSQMAIHGRMINFAADSVTKIESTKNPAVKDEVANGLIQADSFWGKVVEETSSRDERSLINLLPEGVGNFGILDIPAMDPDLLYNERMMPATDELPASLRKEVEVTLDALINLQNNWKKLEKFSAEDASFVTSEKLIGRLAYVFDEYQKGLEQLGKIEDPQLLEVLLHELHDDYYGTNGTMLWQIGENLGHNIIHPIEFATDFAVWVPIIFLNL